MTRTDEQSPFRSIPLLLAGLAATAPAQAMDPLTEAIKNGEANLDTRYRYEAVDQEGMDQDAGASTLRTRLGYRTGKVSNLTGFLEAEHVTRLTYGRQRFFLDNHRFIGTVG